ncbi:MAG TPA: redoxin domain-containing protein [Acidimicrobiales bacterium]|nr:redoxin domain-containing protein [Acidimicrobiales bacterium]
MRERHGRRSLAMLVAAGMGAGLLASCSSQDKGLELGSFSSPLAQIQQLQGEEDHLHVDEVRLRSDNLLLQCSYTFGVIDVSDPAEMSYLAQNLKHVIPGDERKPGCIHLASDGNSVYTTHRGNIRNPAFLSGWDITDREHPVQLPVLQEPGESYEGIDVANGTIYVALHDKGIGAYRRGADGMFARIGTGTGFKNAWGVLAHDNTLFVADGVGGLVTVDVTDPTKPAILGQVATGGQARHVALDGDTAYVAAGSAGLVAVDVSDLTKPRVLSHTATPGPAIRVDFSAGRVFVAAWNDARVYDVADPKAPAFIGAARMTHQLEAPEGDRPLATSRVLGIAAKDDLVYVGNWHLVYSFRLYPDRKAPSIVLPEATELMDFGKVKPGKTADLPLQVTNQGTAPLTLAHNWVQGSAYTVKPEQVKIEPGQSADLTITFAPTKTDREVGYLQLLSDDPREPLRKAYLVGNQPGISVGSMLPETKAVMLDGSPWSSADAAGKVMLINYFATFCPVCGTELPDVQERFYNKYQDQGLEVVGLNAHDKVEQIAAVDDYRQNLGITFPLGIEETKTYAGLQENFVGLNPFPTDVIVGKDGRIEYIAREYDPGAIETTIKRLLTLP